MVLGAQRILTTSTGHLAEVIVEWNEGHSFTFEIPDGLVSIIKILRETWSVEPTSQGTAVVVRMSYETKNGIHYSLLDTLFVRRALKKMLTQNLAGLKHHIETEKGVIIKGR